eukprot:260409-Prymnesium_polylepis.1
MWGHVGSHGGSHEVTRTSRSESPQPRGEISTAWGSRPAARAGGSQRVRPLRSNGDQGVRRMLRPSSARKRGSPLCAEG